MQTTLLIAKISIVIFFHNSRSIFCWWEF